MTIKNKKKLWFASKKYGIGWGLPVSWEGWVVLMGYLILVLVATPFLEKSPILFPLYMIYLFVLTGILILICYKRGEPMKWRWGDKDRKK